MRPFRLFGFGPFRRLKLLNDPLQKVFSRLSHVVVHRAMTAMGERQTI